MPRKAKVGDAVFARGVSHLAPTINEIAERHRILPADLIRGLLEAACDFYKREGYFSFPVVILPEQFQLRRVAEDQAPYPANFIPPAEAAAMNLLSQRVEKSTAGKRK